VSWGRFLGRGRWDDERRRELESYLEIEIDELVARGVAPDEARRRAAIQLGSATRVREEIYRMNTIGWLESLWQDLRYGARLLVRNPGFAAVALLSLALGIGANAAIFQLLDAVRLRTLPVPEPEALVEVRIAPGKSGRTGQFTGRRPNLTRPLWDAVRGQRDAFTRLFAWGNTRFDLADAGESRFVDGLWVSAEFFDALGARPALGRLTASTDEARVCADAAAVVSYPFWQRELGGAADVIGRSIRLDGHVLPIGGVAPKGFFGVEVGRGFDVAVPICAEPAIRPRRGGPDENMSWWLAAFGRLRPGWTAERATAVLQAASPAVFAGTVSPAYNAADAASYRAFTLEALPTPTGVSSLRRDYGTPLALLLAIAGLVLFIACANLANLMLARATARDREIAVRLAIGASRGRVVRQLLAESLLVACLGAALGAALAGLLSRTLVAFLATTSATWVLDLSFDWRLFGFAMGLAGLTCLLFGLAPALRATRTSAGAAMKSSGRGATASRERLGLRRVLVVAQIAVSLVLLVGALLFVRTFANLGALDTGFRQDGVLVANFDLRPARVPLDRQVALQRRLVDRLAALPGVGGAASAAIVPVSGSGWNRGLVIDGQPQDGYANANRVSPDFFRTMAIRMTAGRGFDRRDTPTSPKVAIVNEAFVAKYLPAGSPLGRIFRLDVGPQEADPAYEVVGVVADTTYNRLRDPVAPIMFFPDTQEDEPGEFLSVLMAASGSSDALRAAVASAAAEEAPGTLVSFQTINQLIGDALVRERLMATLSAGFAVLAVVLAAVGLYGVMSYIVARRRGEIGVRIALGATRLRVMALIVRETAVLVGVGAVVGAGLAVFAARSTSALVFGVEPGDPLTIAAAVIGLALVAGVASALPAHRAARLEPTTALREE
jgi:predicted permease